MRSFVLMSLLGLEVLLVLNIVGFSHDDTIVNTIVSTSDYVH